MYCLSGRPASRVALARSRSTGRRGWFRRLRRCRLPGRDRGVVRLFHDETRRFIGLYSKIFRMKSFRIAGRLIDLSLNRVTNVDGATAQEMADVSEYVFRSFIQADAGKRK